MDARSVDSDCFRVSYRASKAYPTDGIINIVKRNASSAKIEVFSYTGQLVFSDIFEDYFYTFNLYNKGTGMYIIRIKDSENISTFKIFCK